MVFTSILNENNFKTPFVILNILSLSEGSANIFHHLFYSRGYVTQEPKQYFAVFFFEGAKK
jgi:hypothetical protein